ncbi:hypothetical protein BDQ12DRAFT_688754 [Crucibulum laeve]|uniref:Oxidase ustYa n=1 Tax=Crucibulum laeve TaxID=68775 RepID=A0A5C3M239_9AGAR|nr:hypothetical protein BDQ12DRAFT_688754 [Crucibulum laeve]
MVFAKGICTSILAFTLLGVVLLFSSQKASLPFNPPASIISRLTSLGYAYEWDINLPLVLMDFQNTVNYQLNGSVADAQWEAMMPQNDGLIYLGPEKQPFMLSVFHQLRCLDIMRRAYTDGAAGGDSHKSPLARHCLNYIRQMVYCRGDLRLERVVDPNGPHAVQVRDPQTCRDWRAVYSKLADLEERDR